jgi:hypothetical protein
MFPINVFATVVCVTPPPTVLDVPFVLNTNPDTAFVGSDNPVIIQRVLIPGNEPSAELELVVEEATAYL